MWNIILPILLFITSIFLILLVLIQRGRGGGLAGAFGGLGGQSAFGTKAGDLFTRITIGVAACWIILCALSVKLLNDTGSSMLSQDLGGAAKSAELPAGLPASGAATDKAKQAAPAADAKESDTKAADSAPAADGKATEPASTEPTAPATESTEKSK